MSEEYDWDAQMDRISHHCIGWLHVTKTAFTCQVFYMFNTNPIKLTTQLLNLGTNCKITLEEEISKYPETSGRG